MPEELSRPEGGPPAERKGTWCSKCGALPDMDCKPTIRGALRGELVYILPCSVRGCAGEVLLSLKELQDIRTMGVASDNGNDLKALRKLQEQAASEMVDKDNLDPTERAAMMRVNRLATLDLLKLGGMLGEGRRAPRAPVPSVSVTNIFSESGDPIDQRLDKMYEAEVARRRFAAGGHAVLPAEVVEEPPAGVGGSDEGGWA